MNVDLDANKIVRKSKTGTATYKEIKEYINDKYGFTVSSLNIAQIKDKCGLEKRNNYNKGVDGHKVPTCPAKKEKALLDNVIKLRDDEPSGYYCLDGIFI